MENTQLFKIVGIFGSVIFSVIGFLMKRKRERLLRSGIPVEGIVFALNSDGDHEKPLIRFTTLKNEWITKEYDVGFAKGQLKEGQKVNVHYNASDPSDFVLNTTVEKWLPLIFIGGGLLGAVILLLSLVTDKF